jgi:predicted RNA-binding protein YlqC (UPF0109 family)
METMDKSGTATDSLGELVAYIASSIVDDPTQVQVDHIVGESTIMFELSVAPGDVGRVIGKKGRTANAIRTLLRAVSGHLGKRTSLEIIS